MGDGDLPADNGDGGYAEASVIDPRFVEYAQSRDRRVRNALIEEYESLARQLARKFRDRGEPLDDLTQVALLGLLKAVERFDPHQGTAFPSFATPTILGELRRHFRDKGWAIRVPRRLQELNLAIGNTLPVLVQELGRTPTVAEVARRIDSSVDLVLEAMDAGQAYRTTSMEALTSSESGDAGTDHLAVFGQTDHRLDQVEDSMTVEALLELLPEREQVIFRLRFQRNLTQSQIAEEIGISQMHVSRLLSAGIARLRSHMPASTN